MPFPSPPSTRWTALCLLAALAGCGAAPVSTKPSDVPGESRIRDRHGTLLGENGIKLFGTKRDGDEAPGTTGIGVNAWLWRATLDTLDFLPLLSADPFGGLILSDWYQPASSPDERLKVQVAIKDQRLRADALKVDVFRQVRRDGAWLDSPTDPATSREIEDCILTRARELRVAQAGG
ncbi:MAG: DUF3576 domain-containing protein [Geminicoccaceae bacterium]|nr:DUF3576 domain-containing protein [Geminicoccaceae bacterium]